MWTCYDEFALGNIALQCFAYLKKCKTSYTIGLSKYGNLYNAFASDQKVENFTQYSKSVYIHLYELNI